MPAVSKAQQQAAGAALAAKEKGKTTGLKGAAKTMAKMTKKELEKIASTKHKGLPKHVKESIKEGKMEEAETANNLTFWVVERPKTPTDDPMGLYFETDPLGFVRQVMGGLRPEEILGFFTSEDEASTAAHDQVEAVMEAAKNLEEKKHMTTSKIEEAIKELQKEVNRCMEEGKDQRAQQVIQKIAELRSKHKMVEASKKPLEEKEK